MKLGNDLGGAMGGGPTHAGFSRQVGHGELSVLAPFVHTPSRRHEHIVNWLSIADPIRREAARQYLYARLNERLVPRARLLAPSSAVSQVRCVRRFFEHLDDRWDGIPLAMVDEGIYASYLAELRRPRPPAAALSAASQSLLVHAVKSLWSFRALMAADALRIEPWPGRSSNRVVGRQRESVSGTVSCTAGRRGFARSPVVFRKRSFSDTRSSVARRTSMATWPANPPVPPDPPSAALPVRA